MERTYPKISINIVAWNSMRFLPDLLTSIEKQTFRDFTVLIIDNGSTDEMEKFVRAQYPNVMILRNAKNLGFSAAHNQGIRYALDRWSSEVMDERYVLVTNPDVVLSETFLETLVKEADEHKEVGSFGGKLFRAFGEHLNDEALSEIVKSDILDSTGLRPRKNGTCADRGAGEMDKNQYDQEGDVFGITGALVLYRANALQDARYQDEFFDVDFFAYKEDVDLAWRLQHLGWNARFVPTALAYHYRGMFGKERMNLWQRFKNRRHKSAMLSYYSSRNQWMVLFKNLNFSTILLWFPRLVVTEGLRVLFTVVFETRNVKSFIDAISFAPKMYRKRQDTLKRSKCTAKALRGWFV